jgi:hypothetical protein
VVLHSSAFTVLGCTHKREALGLRVRTGGPPSQAAPELHTESVDVDVDDRHVAMSAVCIHAESACHQNGAVAHGLEGAPSRWEGKVGAAKHCKELSIFRRPGPEGVAPQIQLPKFVEFVSDQIRREQFYVLS